jgi:GNAT superfamily N-acetyltransferase
MKQLQNIDELSSLISASFRKGTSTNNYVLLDAYTSYIAQGKLSFITTEDNVIFLLEKHDFYQLYFYINNFAQTIQLPDDRPIVMEIIYRGLSNEPAEILDYWSEHGFNKHLTRDNLTAALNKIEIPASQKSSTLVTFAKQEAEVVFTHQLLEKALDRYTGDLLSLHELSNYCAQSNLLCAYHEGEIAGVLQFEIKNKVVWLGHIAVDERFRGKGIANELVTSYILENKMDDNTRYALWVIQDNMGAVNLYRKFGFVYGGKSTVSLLKIN